MRIYLPNGGRGDRLVVHVTILAFLMATLGVACVPPHRRLPAELPEVSGMAYVDASALLLVNDGGNPPLVYGLDSVTAPVLRTVAAFDSNRDWEALAYDRTGRRYVICDVGDNSRTRDSVAFVVSGLDGSGSRYALAYPDGAHDCEACLLRGDTVTLVTKARTLGGARTRAARVYRADWRGAATLALVDSFALRRRSVTDAVMLGPDTVAVLAYDFRFFGPLPFSKTSVFIGTWADLRQNCAREIKVRAPFTLTQYEAIADPRDGRRRLLIASERTPLGPQRYRWIGY